MSVARPWRPATFIRANLPVPATNIVLVGDNVRWIITNLVGTWTIGAGPSELQLQVQGLPVLSNVIQSAVFSQPIAFVPLWIPVEAGETVALNTFGAAGDFATAVLSGWAIGL